MAAMMEYLAAEVLELIGNVACDNKKMRIILRHLLLPVRNYEELNKLHHQRSGWCTAQHSGDAFVEND